MENEWGAGDEVWVDPLFVSSEANRAIIDEVVSYRPKSQSSSGNNRFV